MSKTQPDIVQQMAAQLSRLFDDLDAAHDDVTLALLTCLMSMMEHTQQAELSAQGENRDGERRQINVSMEDLDPAPPTKGKPTLRLVH